MEWRAVAARAGKVLGDNSPAILTAIGVTGTLTTAVLTGKATLKAASILSEEAPDLPVKEKIEKVWKEYIPAVGMAALTITCIIYANRIGAKRLAGLAAAYNIAEKAAATYKDKVIETIGKKKEETLRTAIAQDEIDRHPISRETVFIEGGGSDLFRDNWSGRYFNSSVDRLEKAANEINRRLNSDYSATLSDWYDLVGLDHIQGSDAVGWNSDNLLELSFTRAKTSDDRPCGVVWFQVEPEKHYNSFR